jgi:hypothetical protein
LAEQNFELIVVKCPFHSPDFVDASVTTECSQVVDALVLFFNSYFIQ